MEKTLQLRAQRRFGIFPLWVYLTTALAIALLTGGIEWMMGRNIFSTSGRILLWVSEINGRETSQQIADWYSVTHVTHGLVIYPLIWLLYQGLRKIRGAWGGGRLWKWAFGWVFVVGVVGEAAWEVLENSPFIINRFRETTAANGYYGDSILNSMTDVLSCAVGLILARYLPARVTVVVFVLLEAVPALVVRDSFLLSLIMLIHPFEVIKRWQMGAG